MEQQRRGRKILIVLNFLTLFHSLMLLYISYKRTFRWLALLVFSTRGNRVPLLAVPLLPKESLGLEPWLVANP